MPLLAALCVGAIGFLPGCLQAREVEVSGTVQSGDNHEVVLEFYDRHDGKWQFVRSVNLTEPGDFHESVYAEGDQIRVVAVDDTDFSGECTPGEPWGTGVGSIRDDDTTSPIPVDVAEQRVCPPEED